MHPIESTWDKVYKTILFVTIKIRQVKSFGMISTNDWSTFGNLFEIVVKIKFKSKPNYNSLEIYVVYCCEDKHECYHFIMYLLYAWKNWCPKTRFYYIPSNWNIQSKKSNGVKRVNMEIRMRISHCYWLRKEWGNYILILHLLLVYF